MGNSAKGNPFTPKNELRVLSAEVSARLCGSDAVITLSLPKKKGLWSAVMEALHSHNLDVINATLTTNADTNFHCIHCKLTDMCDLKSEHQLLAIFDDLIMTELRIKPYRV